MKKIYMYVSILLLSIVFLAPKAEAYSLKDFFKTVVARLETIKPKTTAPAAASLYDARLQDIVKEEYENLDTPTKESLGVLTDSVIKIIVDEKTVEEIPPTKTEEILSVSKIVSYGMKEDKDVYVVQKRLGNLGYLKSADGAYGKMTMDAVLRFQKDKGIKGDGQRVDETTLSALGITLILRTNTDPEKILFLSGGNDTNIASTALNNVYASPDMFNWNQMVANNPQSSTIWSPRYYPETFYFQDKYWVIGDWTSGYQSAVNDVWSSPDGVNWTLINSNPPFKAYKEYRTAIFNGKIYVTGGGSPTVTATANVWSSPDGVNWTTVTINAPFGVRARHVSFVFNGKLYVMGGHNPISGTLFLTTEIWSSPDGTNWNLESNNLPRLTDGGKVLVYNNKIYLFGPNDNQNPNSNLNIWTSMNGNNWLPIAFPLDTISHQYPGVVVARGKMWYQNVNASSDNKLYSSTNGYTWVESCANLPWSPRYFNFNSMISNGGTPANTPDPCVQQTANDTVLTLAGGNDVIPFQSFNDIYYSNNMQVWVNFPIQPLSPARWSPRRNPQALHYNNKYWIIGGETPTNPKLSDVWNSTDGLNWNQVATTTPFANYYRYKSVVFNNKIYVIGGRASPSSTANAKVWSTTDGVNWTETTAPFKDRENPTVWSTGSSIWLIGGVETSGPMQDTWYSFDGINWTGSNSFPASVSDGKVIILNNKEYFIGGTKWDRATNTGSSNKSVWRMNSSTHQWDLISNNFPSGDAAMSTIDAYVANGKIWVSDFANVNPNVNHLWSSTDGITWIQENSSLPWSPRNGYKMIAKGQ